MAWRSSLKQAVFRLAGKEPKKAQTKSRETARPLGFKNIPDMERIGKENIREISVIDPIIYNTIEALSQIIMAAGYRIKGEEKDVEFIQDFLDSIGRKGAAISWNQMLYQTFKFQFIFGNSWWELVPNKKGDAIVDIDLLDPVKMGPALDNNKNIVIDESLNPVGYVMTLPDRVTYGGAVLPVNRITPPERVHLDSVRERFFPSDRVVHFMMGSVGDMFDGIGIVEPVYKVTKAKLAVEQAWANWAIHAGQPRLVATHGNEQRDPSPDMMDETLEILSQSKFNTVIAVPWWIKLEYVEPARMETLRTNMDYLIDQQITGMGLPSAFALGRGGEVNRATLGRQEYVLKVRLRTIIDNVLRTIQEKAFRRIIESENQHRPPSERLGVPKVEWNEVAVEDLDAKAGRITKYAKSGVLDIKNPGVRKRLRDFVAISEDLDDFPETEKKQKEETK